MMIKVDGHTLMQIQLPAPDDTDPHPRLILNGWGLHAGQGVEAYIPGQGLVHLSLEISHRGEGAACWYVNTDGFRDVCPVGLWCVVD